jgi:hypothetical protein
MMKVYALLLAMLAVVAIHPAQAAFSCFTYFTRAEAGTAGSQTFTGITTSGSNESYNNPMFYTKAAADAGFTSASYLHWYWRTDDIHILFRREQDVY